MKRIYTKCESIEEAMVLEHFIMCKGYEGVQNDSSRYNDTMIKAAFRKTTRHHYPFCYIGVSKYQLVVGTNKRYMRKCGSYTYIRKPRVFKELLNQTV